MWGAKRHSQRGRQLNTPPGSARSHLRVRASATTSVYPKICTPVFIVALFVTAPDEKYPKALKAASIYTVLHPEKCLSAATEASDPHGRRHVPSAPCAWREPPAPRAGRAAAACEPPSFAQWVLSKCLLRARCRCSHQDTQKPLPSPHPVHGERDGQTSSSESGDNPQGQGWTSGGGQTSDSLAQACSARTCPARAGDEH